MNKVILMGRLTRDPEVRQTQGNNQMGRYTLAVNRRFKRDGEPDADFINCVVFGKSAEFAEKYFRKGMQITISGRIQMGSYMNKGQKIYTTDIIVEEQEFAESRNSSQGNSSKSSNTDPAPNDGFSNIPDDIDEDDLPFN